MTGTPAGGGGQPGAPAPLAPPPLTVATSIVALEAIVLVLYGLTLAPNITGERLVMGASSLLFLVLYGAFLGYAAWRLWRLHAWARAPVVMAQLIQVPVAISFWGGRTTAIAVALLLLALTALAGVFHPQSLDALEQASG